MRSEPVSRHPDRPGGPRRVLIGERDDFVARLIRAALLSAGFTVYRGGEFGDSLRLVRRHRPHVVVIDQGTPALQAGEQLRRLREAATDQPPRILVLSRQYQPAVRERVLSLGADDFMSKPFDPQELVRRVVRLVGDPGAGR